MTNKVKKIAGMTHSEWSDIMKLVHKAQTERDERQRGKKRGGLAGTMDKIIRECPIWNLDELEEKVRSVCLKFDEKEVG
jgi:hypothetical protein